MCVTSTIVSYLCAYTVYKDYVHTYIVLCLWFKEPIINAADADINAEHMLRKEIQQLKVKNHQLMSKLALVQSSEEIMETQPTPAQLTGMLSLILHMCVPSMAYIGRWCVHICRTSWS